MKMFVNQNSAKGIFVLGLLVMLSPQVGLSRSAVESELTPVRATADNHTTTFGVSTSAKTGDECVAELDRLVNEKAAEVCTEGALLYHIDFNHRDPCDASGCYCFDEVRCDKK